LHQALDLNMEVSLKIGQVSMSVYLLTHSPIFLYFYNDIIVLFLAYQTMLNVNGFEKNMGNMLYFSSAFQMSATIDAHLCFSRRK